MDKIVIGFIMDDDTVYSSDKAVDHGDLWHRLPSGATYKKYFKGKWRYNTSNKIVYWWAEDKPFTDIEKNEVAEHLKMKYNVQVLKHEIISGTTEDEYNKQYRKAHGLNEMKRLLMEGIKEKAAED